MDDPSEEYRRQLKRLYRIVRELSNPSAIALRINKRLAKDGYVQAIVDNRFESQGASSGSPWAALTANTVKQRRQQGFGPGPILERKGVLRAAATVGKATATADQITLTFTDGPSPMYIGGGRAKKNRLIPIVADSKDAARAAGTTFAGKSGRLSDYADALNKRRPFYGKPTAAELQPIFTARDALIQRVIDAIVNGQSLGSAGI